MKMQDVQFQIHGPAFRGKRAINSRTFAKYIWFDISHLDENRSSD